MRNPEDPARQRDPSIIDRVRAQQDDDEMRHSAIQAAFRTGADDTHDYWLLVMEKTYDNREYVNIRYFMTEHDGADTEVGDTWMKNGINMRRGDGTLLSELGKALIATYKGYEGPMVKDISEE